MGRVARQVDWHHKASVRLGVSLVVGLVAGLLVRTLWRTELSFVTGWSVGALTFCLWVWLSVRTCSPQRTQEMSLTDDPGRRVGRALVVVASLASLVGVGVLLASGHAQHGERIVDLLLGIASVAMSWVTVHLVYMLTYAELYYGDGNKGLSWPGDEEPDYRDFAYFSFCLGMTYQVSDNNISNKLIRRTVTRHTLLSYVLGAVVVASMVNLVVQIASQG